MRGGGLLGSVGRGLSRFGEGVINQRASLYGIWYIISILGFALVYCLLPAEAFHAPYVAREPQSAENGFEFEPFITERMRRSSQTWTDSSFVNFDMNNVSVLRIGADPARNTVRVVIAYRIGDKPQQPAAIDINIFSLPAGNDRCHEARIAQDESSADAEGNADIMDILFRDTPGCASAHYLRLAPDDEQTFRNYALALSGRTKYVHHYGLRMIAFSAMTITTTSDGSLVPTMRTSRILVALEPTWGVFMLGLAIRALVRRGS